MHLHIPCRFPLALPLALALVCGALAQQPASSNSQGAFESYDITREVTLIGTVKSYTPAAQAALFGPHLTLQTSGGLVDVHLGDGRFLAANHFSIQTGDTLRIVGENLVHGATTQFVARILQNGTHALTVRSVRGLPLSYTSPPGRPPSKPQGGVL